MAGIANSWIGEVYAQPTPCMGGDGTTNVNNTTTNTTISSCLLWLVAGLVIGGILKGSNK